MGLVEDGYRDDHASYGKINISRNSGSGRALCGSSIRHQNTITVEICTAQLERRLHGTHFYGIDDIVEIELSPTQFTDAITNMNTSGVPCTIRRVNGKRTAECPFTDAFKEFENEFRDDIKNVLGMTNKMIKLAEEKLKGKGTLNRADRDELAAVLYKIEQDIRSNIPFLQSQFNKQVDQTVNEAKAEVEAFFTSTIHRLGSDKLIEELENGVLQLPIGTME